MRGLLRHPTVREARHYVELTDGAVRCVLCERRCRIPPGRRGVCKTRVNVDGTLYTLVYGALSAVESRPIEIKPFFHYWPGSTALTVATWSCNFDCAWCQNHHLSKTEPTPETSRYHPPEQVVEAALRRGDDGLCASFQEPTLLADWLRPLFRTGRNRGLYCCCVSNGYMTPEALRDLKAAGLDGVKIDVKGDAEAYRQYCGGVDVETVWRNIGAAKRLGLHVEVVNLVVTGVNDDDACLREVIERHLKAAGTETPLHFTRYHPAHRFRIPPTPIATLETAYRIARQAGVCYPYLGNVRGHRYENTVCPNCGEPVIQRLGCAIRSYRVTPNKTCPGCGRPIPITGQYMNQGQ